MKIGLGAKFVLLVIIILSATMSVTTIYANKSQSKVFHDQLYEKLNQLGSFISLISTDAMLANDYTLLEDYMKEAVSRPDMVYGVILDPRGFTLTSHLNRAKKEIRQAVNRSRSEDLKKIFRELKKDSSIVFRDFTIRLDEEVIGKVRLGISLKRFETLAEKSLIQLSIINGIIILFLGITLYLVFRISALRPIESLMQGSNRIGEGNLETPVDIHARDELGELSMSFNQMMKQLKLNIHEKDDFLRQLSELNNTLEEKVISRTQALQESETRTRTIYDNMGEGIIVVDEKGFIETVNKSALRIFDTNKDALIGVHIMLLLDDKTYENIISPENYIDSESDSNKSSQARNLLTAEGKSMNGKEFPMEIVVTTMNLGQRTLRVCIVRDISKRKEVESRLAESQERVVEAAHQAGMAEMATGVLHNIGNVLNSVSVSAEVISRTTKSNNISGLMKANNMLSDNMEDIGNFLKNNVKGKRLPEYYLKLGQILEKDADVINTEIDILNQKITMIKDVISTQQNYAKMGSFEENICLTTIVDDALKVQDTSLYKAGVSVKKEFCDSIPDVIGQKSKLLQVVTNLIKNAQEAMIENDINNKKNELIISIGREKGDLAYISVQDNGCGIDESSLSEIFGHGYTTKKTGHGFGLHASANAMTEMKGTLTVYSEGLGFGSCFKLTLPINNEQVDQMEMVKLTG